jgi:hypothetical protein
LLFVKTQVVERALRQGSCLATKRKQRLKNKLDSSKRQRKRRRGQEARTVAEEAQAQGALIAPNSKDNKLRSKLQLMYNLV